MAIQRPAPFAERIAGSARPLIGTWVKIPSLETVEILGNAGFDYVVIDLEHAPLGLQDAYAATVVAQASGMSVLVRVPDTSGSHVQRLLDAGVDGLLVPHVRSAAEAALQVARMTFPPDGVRGMGTTGRAGAWGGTSGADYVAAGRHVFRGVQLEDWEALEDAEGIVSTPGLGGAFIGMGDLGLGRGLRSPDPELDALVARTMGLALARGVPVGTAVGTPEQFGRAAEAGYAFVMVSNDTGMLRAEATRIVRESIG
ncbi:MAG TPA: aldolase/citrate lyase family protein [Microbacteriaceae bacterium]|nr:aldolase/citrate lyase family protein [Microbacteriaceae bacterium]